MSARDEFEGALPDLTLLDQDSTGRYIEAHVEFAWQMWQRISELVQQCEKLREERNAVRVKVEQPLLLRIRELEFVLRAMERMATHCDQGQYIDYAGARTIFEDARELLEPPR